MCFDAAYADTVEAAVAEHLKRSTRAEITQASLDNQGLVVVVPDIAHAFGVVNTIAPEHLELHMANAADMVRLVRNAGAIFVGGYSPEAVGDYVAGPNHTLPTGGTARFSSPLSVDQFCKKSSIISYSPEALQQDADAIMCIAQREGLWAHGQSVRLRVSALAEANGKNEE